MLDYETVCRLTDSGAEIDYTVTTNGNNEVTVALYDGDVPVAQAGGKTGTLEVNPRNKPAHAPVFPPLIPQVISQVIFAGGLQVTPKVRDRICEIYAMIQKLF